MKINPIAAFILENHALWMVSSYKFYSPSLWNCLFPPDLKCNATYLITQRLPL